MKKGNWLTIAGTMLVLAGCSDSLGPTASQMKPSAPNLGSFGSPNAAFTTINETADGANFCLNGPGVVNCNIYTEKQYVWLNGGPTGSVNGLGEGTYFFAVLSPSGQNAEVNDGANVGVGDAGTTTNLSDDFDAYTDRTFTIDGSGIVSYAGPHNVTDNGTADTKIRLMPYSNTLNPGGVYILAICSYPPIPAQPAQCKYDAFKVRSSGGGGGGGGGDPLVSGLKYYDTNTNGQWDAGEPGIPGWKIDVTGSATTTLTTVNVPAGTFDMTLTAGGVYTFTEKQAKSFKIGAGPVNGYWSQTGNTVDQFFDFLNSTVLTNKVYTVTAATDGVTTGLNFGNVCYENPGGLTIGFWSNKNGQNLETAADFTALNALNLRNANGTDKDFGGSLANQKSTYSSWLLAANATNMAYMLSAQLSATVLNVRHGITDGTFVVDGSMTVNQLIVYANGLLANPISGGPFNLQNGGVTINASALRTEQERVKNIFDKINNNGTLGGFLQGASNNCPISF